MNSINRFIVLLLPLILCVLVPSQAPANQALDPELILALKKGHMGTCLPTITRQIKSTGLPVSRDKIELYCECLGNFYFNDLTKREFSEMEKNNGGLPERIARQRRAIQEYCLDVHFK